MVCKVKKLMAVGKGAPFSHRRHFSWSSWNTLPGTDSPRCHVASHHDAPHLHDAHLAASLPHSKNSIGPDLAHIPHNPHQANILLWMMALGQSTLVWQIWVTSKPQQYRMSNKGFDLCYLDHHLPHGPPEEDLLCFFHNHKVESRGSASLQQ